MRTREAARILQQVADEARAASDVVAETRPLLLEWMDQHYPLSRIGGGGRSSGHSDPTLTTVLKSKRDFFQRTLTDLDRAIIRSRQAIRQVQAEVDKAKILEDPSAGAMGCRLCAKGKLWKFNENARRAIVGVHPEAFQPIYSEGLCRWCANFVAKYGIDPHPELVEHHLDNLGSESAPIGLIRALHPDVFEEHHTTPTAHRQFGLETLQSDAQELSA